MWTSYGGRVRSGGLSEVRDLTVVLARLERWTLPLAIAILFAYPNPLVPVALAVLVASGVVRALRRTMWSRIAPVDPWLALFAVGTLVGLTVAHHQDAALLRVTGIVGALALFYLVRGFIGDERGIRHAGLTIIAMTTVGILSVLALLRGSLPESSVTTALSPLLVPFSVFPGVSGDTLEVNARFTVHQYGLAQLLLIGAVFAVAAIALSRGRWLVVSGGAALVVLVPLLLATQARGAFLALALAATSVAAFRTRLAWLIPPFAGGLLYVLLARGTISRGVEAEWLNQRLGYWTGTLALLGDLPLTGAGLGMRTFAEVFAWYHQLPDPYQVSHTHNVVIQAYAEQGLFGTVGLAGLLIVGSAIGFRAAHRARGQQRWLVAGAAGAFLGSATYGVTDQVPTNNLSLALLLALLATTMAADRFWAPSSSPPAASAVLVDRSATPRRRRLVLAAMALLAVVGLAALSPRWVSGLYLNAGSSQLLAAVLDRSRDPELRTARLQRAESLLAEAVRWNDRNLPALRNLAWAKLLRHDLTGAISTIEVAYRPDLTSFERAQLARLASDAGLVGLTIKLYQEGGDEARLRQLAERLWATRRWHDAALAYAGLTELNPDEIEYVSNFAKVILEGGGDDRDAAIALVTAAQRKPEAARNLARQLVLTGEPFRANEKRAGGNFPAARFWFALASQVDPTYDRPEVELGSIHFYRGLFPEAAEHFHEAQRRDPKNASTFSQLGETYLKLGRTEEAVRFFEQGAALRPERPELHLNLGRAYLAAGRPDDARRELDAALQRAPAGSDVQNEIREELRLLGAGG
jgi:tetratricopeptide (TPR) repeat protein/O-antigen ligase